MRLAKKQITPMYNPKKKGSNISLKLLSDFKDALNFGTELRSDVRELMSYLLEKQDMIVYAKVKEIDKNIEEILCKIHTNQKTTTQI